MLDMVFNSEYNGYILTYTVGHSSDHYVKEKDMADVRALSCNTVYVTLYM